MLLPGCEGFSLRANAFCQGRRSSPQTDCKEGDGEDVWIVKVYEKEQSSGLVQSLHGPHNQREVDVTRVGQGILEYGFIRLFSDQCCSSAVTYLV